MVNIVMTPMNFSVNFNCEHRKLPQDSLIYQLKLILV